MLILQSVFSKELRARGRAILNWKLKRR